MRRWCRINGLEISMGKLLATPRDVVRVDINTGDAGWGLKRKIACESTTAAAPVQNIYT